MDKLKKNSQDSLSAARDTTLCGGGKKLKSGISKCVYRDYFLKVEQRLGQMQKKASQKIDSNFFAGFQKLGTQRKIVGKIGREMERCVKVYFLC